VAHCNLADLRAGLPSRGLGLLLAAVAGDGKSSLEVEVLTSGTVVSTRGKSVILTNRLAES
jgi:hypothetical protein